MVNAKRAGYGIHILLAMLRIAFNYQMINYPLLSIISLYYLALALNAHVYCLAYICENEKRDNLLHANFAPAAKLLHTSIGPWRLCNRWVSLCGSAFFALE